MDYYRKKYTFGGVTFEVVSEETLTEGHKYEEFLADDCTKPDYVFRIAPVDSDGNTSIKAVREGNLFTVSVSRKYIAKIGLGNILVSANAAYLFPENDGFILHASYIVHNGSAILFSAPSGTGKSTQAEFWRELRSAEVVNGDRVLVTKRDGRFFANGIYVAGTSGISRNVTAPVGNIVILEQGENNEIVSLKPRELFLRILCQCTFDMQSDKQYEQITALVSDLINTVPVCCYRCRYNPDSVEDLERLLWNKK